MYIHTLTHIHRHKQFLQILIVHVLQVYDGNLSTNGVETHIVNVLNIFILMLLLLLLLLLILLLMLLLLLLQLNVVIVVVIVILFFLLLLFMHIIFLYFFPAFFIPIFFIHIVVLHTSIIYQFHPLYFRQHFIPILPSCCQELTIKYGCKTISQQQL